MIGIRLIVLLSLAVVSFGSSADERPDHFRGLPAETLEQALDNFADYNSRLAAILEQDELTLRDLVTIHELTYTLENALERINAELSELAETLESLHVASEEVDYEGTRQHGRTYLETARRIR